jgi:excisionase family DNA binding protein
LEDLVSQAEAARIKGISRQAVSHLVARGRLATYFVGGRHLVSKTEVLNYRDGRTFEGKEQAKKRFK